MPGGWEQTGATCDDGSSPSSIDVAAGETVTCTFSNRKYGQIVVVKDATPNDPQDFTFTAGGGLSPASFELDDDSDATLSNTHTFNDITPGSGYSVAESLPTGWSQVERHLQRRQPHADIAVAAGETVTCTFVNTRGYVRPDRRHAAAGLAGGRLRRVHGAEPHPRAAARVSRPATRRHRGPAS